MEYFASILHTLAWSRASSWKHCANGYVVDLFKPLKALKKPFHHPNFIRLDQICIFLNNLKIGLFTTQIQIMCLSTTYCVCVTNYITTLLVSGCSKSKLHIITTLQIMWISDIINMFLHYCLKVLRVGVILKQNSQPIHRLLKGLVWWCAQNYSLSTLPVW